MAQSGWRILKRRGTVCAVSIAASVLAIAGAATIPGCITHPQDPAATQPATVIDLATTQPAYWLGQPAAAEVEGRDFATIIDVCKKTARDELFTLDRIDYRSGEITTVPMVSKQWFEPWRHDAGTAYETAANSIGAIRRTLSFDIARNPDATFTITPKVLIEREAILERRVTDVSQYRLAFSGPGVKIQPRESVTLEPGTYPDVPVKYWYPIGRDEQMEIRVAEKVKKQLKRRHSIASSTGDVAQTAPATKVIPLQADGVVSDVNGASISINLGEADHVKPGMTFEVYDARATLPALEAYAANNPQSKGWIEVVTVGNGQSTCKVLQRKAVAVRKGDQVFNFIYRRGAANHFAVAGDFSTPRKTVTDLITRWGGAVDPSLTPQTTYLVLGTAPAGAERQTYDAARSQAEQFRIPIVSEERFNLLIRYYDPQKR
jgi:hypothetical protein